MRMLAAGGVLAFAVATAAAQERPPAPAAKPAARKVEPLTFDALEVRPDELPPAIRVVEGVPTVARQPRAFFETPHPRDLAPPEMREKLAALFDGIPAPRRKRSQAFHAEGGRPGAVMWFEYDQDPAPLRSFLPGYLWGKDRGPTAKYPETWHVVGRVLVLTSFPQGDPAHEWWKERLRRRFGVPAPRWSPQLADLGARCVAAMRSKDFAGGLAALDAAPELVGPNAFFHHLRGELAIAKGDWKLAETGYRRALELHEAEDPLEEPIVFAATDGLGGALVMQKRAAEAVPHLERALALGRAGDHEGWKTTLYNLACAEALRKRWPRSLDWLRQAIEAEPRFAEQAKTDGDLAEALKRPEFRKLLGL